MANGGPEKLHRKQRGEELARAIQRTQTQLQPTVGKATLVDAAKPGANPFLFEEAVRELRRAAARLQAAAAIADFDRALDAAAAIDVSLGAARGHVGKRTTELTAVEHEISRVLALAPRMDRDATSAATSGDWTKWDVQRSSWTSNALVQRKATRADKTTIDAPAVASRGVASASTLLPFHKEIQRSFGNHSLANVRVEIGGAAQQAARALHASAFAFGERIAFAQAPDLHTAAHEAAHVIQQRSGIELPGNIDRGDDEHERAADEVADAVVAGKSASHLLERYAGGSRTSSSVVQRKSPESFFTVTAWEYVKIHTATFQTVLARELASVASAVASKRSVVHPRLVELAFPVALNKVLAGAPLFDQISDLLSPIDVMTTIDTYRDLSVGTPGESGIEVKGPMQWNPNVGEAVGSRSRPVLLESFARMVERYEAQIDYQRGHVVSDNLLISHPFDRVVALILCSPDVIDVRPLSSRDKQKQKEAKAFDTNRYGARMLTTFTWLGEKDDRLWNWLEVVEPKDATVEDVAATLADDQGDTSHAAKITAVSPYFRIEPSYARTVLPQWIHTGDSDTTTESYDALALAGSSAKTDQGVSLTTQVAISQVHAGAKHAVSSSEIETKIETIERRLESVKELLVPWKLWDLLVPAFQWVRTQRETLTSIPKDRIGGIASVLEAQASLLSELIGQLTNLIEQTSVSREVPNARTSDAPKTYERKPNTGDKDVSRVVRELAIAAGESHLAQTAKAQQTRALTASNELSIRFIERQLTGHAVATRELTADDETSLSTTDHQRDQREFASRAVKLRAGLERKGSIDPEELDLLSAQLEERTFDAELTLLIANMLELEQSASESRSGPVGALVSAPASEFRHDFEEIGALGGRLQLEVAAPKREAAQQPTGGSVAERTKAIRTRTADAQAARDRFLEETQLRAKIQKFVYAIQRQQIRKEVAKIVLQIATLIAISVATGLIAEAAGVAVEGALLASAEDGAAAIGNIATVARVAGTATNVLVDAGLNTAAQVASSDSDDSAASTFAENAAVNIAVIGALSPLKRLLGATEKDLVNASKWKTFGVTAANFSAHLVISMATNYAVHRAATVLRHGKVEEKDLVQWAIEGGSMAVGHFINLRLKGLHEQIRNSGLSFFATQKQLARALAVSELAKNQKADAALDTLAEYRKTLVAFDAELDTLGTKLKPDQLAALKQANKAAAAELADKSFAVMPLRLSGLQPDDTTGKTWFGSTEQIAIALHQAHEAGVAVTVEDHDVAARKWRVAFNGDELTIFETKTTTRVRQPASHITEEVRARARRYAQASKFLQGQWELRSQAALDQRFEAGEVVEVDYVQAGFAQGGIINQDTRFAGTDKRLVVYDDPGALAGRGNQELGQRPEIFDSPGLRASEQANAGTEWLVANDLDHAQDVGRFEMQVSAYRGRVINLEMRPSKPGKDWRAPNRPWRATLQTKSGPQPVYLTSSDIAIGAGPADIRRISQITDPVAMGQMFADHRLLRGEDPNFGAKARPGKVLVTAGSATGAWDAERFANQGQDVTIAGDDTRAKQKLDWPALLERYDELATAIGNGDSSDATAKEFARIQQSIRNAHGGASLRRNEKPGAAYGQGTRVHIEFGSPTRMSPTDDGKVLVTFGEGATATTTEFDQVIVAEGQDPGAIGGPGALLGKGAQKTGAETWAQVPEGTIKLKPILVRSQNHAQEDLLGFESSEMPGIRFLSASGASKKMLPWVEPQYRQRTIDALDRMKEPLFPTRSYGPVSEDSTNVTTGIEHQRDKIPRANEIETAKKFRFVGPQRTLELDPADREHWDDRVREYLAVCMRAESFVVRVQRIGGGRSKALLWKVWIDTSEVGVFKMFDGEQAVAEQSMLKLLDAAKLTHLHAVKERGTLEVDPKSGYKSAILMSTAEGESVASMIQRLPTNPEDRKAAIRNLKIVLQRVAVGLAEFHRTFASGREMTDAAKHSEVDYVIERYFSGGKDVEVMKQALGSDYQRVAELIQKNVSAPFFKASVSATAYHGDANLGNFVVKAGEVSVIDVETMQWSVDANGKGKTSGAADIARLSEALKMVDPAKLSASESGDLRDTMHEIYVDALGASARGDGFAAAERWYAVQFELTVLANGDSSAKSRLLSLIEGP